MNFEIKDPDHLFNKWFRAPFGSLEALSGGDGALVMLMMILPLYERYLDAAMRNAAEKRRFYTVMSDDLGLHDWQKARDFWEVFRHGFCHTAMPFERNDRGHTLPKVSLHADYPDMPSFRKNEDGDDVICINPWGFGRFVFKKYADDPALLTSHPDAPLLSIAMIIPDVIPEP